MQWLDFSKRSESVFYDLIFDRDLIEASFAMQYNIRLEKEDIRFAEFLRLLSGIMDNTPLGRVVSIRMEDRADKIRGMNKECYRIRNEWRRFIASEKHPEEFGDMEKLQGMLEMMFG